MRAFATHDEAGNITQLVVGPSDGPVAGVVPEPSLLVSEVDLPALDLDLADPTLEGRLLEVIAQYRVVRESETARGRLTRQ